MARPTLIGRDWSRYPGASIAGGSFEANAPGINMLSLRPQAGAISGGGTAFSLNLGATYSVGIVHLQRLVNVSSVSVTVGGFSASRSAPPAGYGDDEFTALGRSLFFVLPTPVDASSVSFTVSGGSPLSIGAVGACQGWSPPFDMATGSSDTILDLSDVQTVPFGSTYITERPVQRRKDCAFTYIPDATQILGGGGPVDYEAEAFRIALISGKHRPVAVVPFPDDDVNIERRALWGRITTDQQFTNQFFGFYSTTFQITQLI